MRWSWSLGTLFGIKVRIHWTFLLLLIWIAASSAGAGGGWLAVLTSLAFIIAVFGCVLLHEAGHALMARRFGVPTVDITLLPIGGLARMQRIPTEPKQELAIAVAGPAVNVVIGALLFAGLTAGYGLGTVLSVQFLEESLLARLMWVNFVLVAFNVLPAFPMDGGRMLRALLAMRMNYSRATNIAGALGQMMAMLFGLIGLFYNPFLLFIALFVFLGAEAEMQAAHLRHSLGDARVRDAMMTRFRVLSPHETVQTAVDELLAGSQECFPVADDGALQGLLQRSDLVQAIKEHGAAATLADVTISKPPVTHEKDDLHATLESMRQLNTRALVVVRDDAIVGLISMENIAEWMMVRAAAEGLEGWDSPGSVQAA